jgi:hypothetical protein
MVQSATVSWKSPSQKRAGGVTQDVGPELKPQYCKKEKKYFIVNLLYHWLNFSQCQCPFTYEAYTINFSYWFVRDFPIIFQHGLNFLSFWFWHKEVSQYYPIFFLKLGKFTWCLKNKKYLSKTMWNSPIAHPLLTYIAEVKTSISLVLAYHFPGKTKCMYYTFEFFFSASGILPLEPFH